MFHLFSVGISEISCLENSIALQNLWAFMVQGHLRLANLNGLLLFIFACSFLNINCFKSFVKMDDV